MYIDRSANMVCVYALRCKRDHKCVRVHPMLYAKQPCLRALKIHELKCKQRASIYDSFEG